LRQKNKSCTRFINVDIGLSGSQVAGAAVDARLPLEKVAKQARHASKLVGTMEVALSWCTLPGKGTSDRLGRRSNGAYLWWYVLGKIVSLLVMILKLQTVEM